MASFANPNPIPIIKTQKIVLVIPEAHYPGTQMTVQTDDGRMFSIIIPNNTKPGENLCVEIHDDAEGGCTVVVAENNKSSSKHSPPVSRH